MKKIIILTFYFSVLFSTSAYAKIKLINPVTDVPKYTHLQKQMYQSYIYGVAPLFLAQNAVMSDRLRKADSDFRGANERLTELREQINDTLDYIGAANSGVENGIAIGLLNVGEMQLINSIKDKENINPEAIELITMSFDSLKSVDSCRNFDIIDCVLGGGKTVSGAGINVAKLGRLFYFMWNSNNYIDKLNSYRIAEAYIHLGIQISRQGQTNFLSISDYTIKSIAKDLEIEKYDNNEAKENMILYRDIILSTYKDKDGKIFDNTQISTNYNPNKPSLTIVDGVNDTSLTPSFRAFNFNDPDEGDTHAKTWWGIIEIGKGYINNFEQVWSSKNKNSIQVPEGILKKGKEYKAVVAFKDNHDNYSNGRFVWFKTKDDSNNPPERPKLEVIDGTSNVSLLPTFKASGYSDEENDEHYMTWWGIRKYGTTHWIFMPGWSENNKYNIKLTEEDKLDAGVKYEVAVAFKDKKGHSPSMKVAFTTIQNANKKPNLDMYDYRYDQDSTSKSDGDGKVENGESVTFDIKLKNKGDAEANDVKVVMDTESECVSRVHMSKDYGNISANKITDYSGMEFSFDDCAKNEKITFDIKITANGGYEWHDSLAVRVVDDREPSNIEFVSFKINDDNERSSAGNSDGKANLGETLEIYPTIRNLGDIKAENIKAYLTSNDECVEILTRDYIRWNDLDSKEIKEGGEYNKDSSRRFIVRIKPHCAIGHRINFDVKITSDGENEWYDTFNIKVYEMPTDFELSIIDYNVTDDRCLDSLGFWHEVEGAVNPCDEIDIDIKLKNTSNKKYGKIEGTVETYDDSCVNMTDETRWYDVNASSDIWSDSKKDIDFTVTKECQIGHMIEFYVTFETDLGVWTDSFKIPVEKYNITPDLTIKYIKPYELKFDEGKSIEFEVNVKNDGDRVVNNSVQVELGISNEPSCTASLSLIENITVPALGDNNSEEKTFSLQAKKEWDGKYIIAKVVAIAGEVNLENNCYIGNKITVIGLAVDTDINTDPDDIDVDSDNDGISDTDEINYGFDPLDPNDATQDKDKDGISNKDEILAGTDPNTSNELPKETAKIPLLKGFNFVSLPMNGQVFTNTFNDSIVRVVTFDTDKNLIQWKKSALVNNLTVLVPYKGYFVETTKDTSITYEAVPFGNDENEESNLVVGKWNISGSENITIEDVKYVLEHSNDVNIVYVYRNGGYKAIAKDPKINEELKKAGILLTDDIKATEAVLAR